MTIPRSLALTLALTLTPPAFAADPKPATPATAAKPAEPKKEKPTFLTVEDAGPDYKLQGEYEGDAGSANGGKIGVHVLALGDDQFRAVFYEGGLPGAGWNQKTRKQADGKRAGDAVTFKVENADVTYTVNADGTEIAAIVTAGGDKLWTAKKVTRQSPTLGAKPPEGAKVLFAAAEDAAKNWQNGHADARGLLAAGTKTKDKFKDFSLHIEFLLPFKPLGRGQDRGNSGVYLQDRYECQVLDSFALKGENNECGGFYQQFAPSVNMCLPPLQWQTYDIDFTAAKFDAAGQKTAPARVTVRHNGVTIHDNVELKKPTPGGGLSGKDNADPGPIQLQGHGNPVFFRNIWIVERQ
jgi:hypothetical protein